MEWSWEMSVNTYLSRLDTCHVSLDVQTMTDASMSGACVVWHLHALPWMVVNWLCLKSLFFPSCFWVLWCCSFCFSWVFFNPLFGLQSCKFPNFKIKSIEFLEMPWHCFLQNWWHLKISTLDWRDCIKVAFGGCGANKSMKRLNESSMKWLLSFFSLLNFPF